MIQVSPAEINERWDTLSFELRDFILSSPFNDLIKKICLENNVSDSTDFIQGTVDLRLEGFMDDESLISGISEAVGAEKGKIIAENIMASVPENIKKDIPGSDEPSISPFFIEKDSAPELGMPEMGAHEAPVETSAITPSTKTLTAMGESSPVVTEENPNNRIPVKAQLENTAAASSIVFSTPKLNNPSSEVPAAQSAAPKQQPAPFILHRESEVLSVVESSSSAGKFSPLRPEFYTPNLEEMREVKPSFAKLQFGSSSVVDAPNIPVAAEKSSEIKISQPSLSDKGPIPENNVVNLKDLPL